MGSKISTALYRAPRCTRTRFQCMFPRFQKHTKGLFMLQYDGGDCVALVRGFVL